MRPENATSRPRKILNISMPLVDSSKNGHAISRRILKLVSLANHGTIRIIEKIEPGPYFEGGGLTNLLCGRCAGILAKCIDPLKHVSVLFRCPKCQSLNDPTSYFVPH